MRPLFQLGLLIVALAIVSGCAAAPEIVPPQAASAPGGADAAPPTIVAPVQTPTLAPTPVPALVRLTEPGCCTQPDWSADSSQVRFIDRPTSTSVVGLYAVGLAGGTPALVSERLGDFSPDDRHLAYPEAGETYVEDINSGQRWQIDNGGRRVAFSPDSTRLVWTRVVSSDGGFDRRPVEFNVTSLDGTPITQPFTFYGGGFNGWLDDDHLLVVGKPEPDDERGLYSLALSDGTLVELARGDRLRSALPAPGGEWVAYLVLFDQEEPANNGIWVVSAGGQTNYKLDSFGALQWRDAERLLLVPQDAQTGADDGGHRIVEIHAPSGETTLLTDPAAIPFTVEGGDWRVSPDGEHVAFVSSADRAIWLLTLP